VTFAVARLLAPVVRFVHAHPRLRAHLRVIRRKVRQHGWGRWRDPLREERRILNATRPLREQVKSWAWLADHSAPLNPVALADALATNNERLVICVSHDDYVLVCGGIQNVIANEHDAFQADGLSCLHMSPAEPLPVLAPEGPAESYYLRLRLNGELLGVASFATLTAAFNVVRDGGMACTHIVHHLKGHAPEHLASLATGGTRPIVWVHDYFSLCPSFNLLRNDVRYCGGPPPWSAACSVCVFRDDRAAHQPRVRAYFAATRPVVVAPSDPALQLWRQRAQLLYAEAHVLAPAMLRMDGEAVGATRMGIGPLRIAHLGAAIPSKGWSVFRSLAEHFAQDPRYKFHQLGIDGSRSRCYVYDPVMVGREDRHAMIREIVRHAIDVAIIWSIWPETFSFTAHEALAGGAFVVTHLGAGNVWPAIAANAPDQGIAVDDAAALFALFDSGEIVSRVARAPRRRGTLIPGRGTADLIRRMTLPDLARHPMAPEAAVP